MVTYDLHCFAIFADPLSTIGWKLGVRLLVM